MLDWSSIEGDRYGKRKKPKAPTFADVHEEDLNNSSWSKPGRSRTEALAKQATKHRHQQQRFERKKQSGQVYQMEQCISIHDGFVIQWVVLCDCIFAPGSSTG